jgi:tRNA-splicing ligase RtcB
VAQGYGRAADLDRIEERGAATGAELEEVSERAKERQRKEIGALGFNAARCHRLRTLCRAFRA